MFNNKNVDTGYAHEQAEIKLEKYIDMEYAARTDWE